VKIDGANPGFRIKTASGKVHVLKFDAIQQWGRASTGDVVGSRLSWAAGFQAPCNRIVQVRTEELELPEQEIKDPGGKTLTRERILELMQHLPREKDGTVRALASEFPPRKPLGPWLYEGTGATTQRRRGPPGTARASRLTPPRRLDQPPRRALAEHARSLDRTARRAWPRRALPHRLGRHPGRPAGLGQRLPAGGLHLLHRLGPMGADFITFGAVERPWERASFGPAGPIWGYFDDREFVPEDWHVGYPNTGVLGDGGGRRSLDGTDHLPSRRRRPVGHHRRGAPSMTR
jgi:hypothetical protein